MLCSLLLPHSLSCVETPPLLALSSLSHSLTLLLWRQRTSQVYATGCEGMQRTRITMCASSIHRSDKGQRERQKDGETVPSTVTHASFFPRLMHVSSAITLEYQHQPLRQLSLTKLNLSLQTGLLNHNHQPKRLNVPHVLLFDETFIVVLNTQPKQANTCAQRVLGGH